MGMFTDIFYSDISDITACFHGHFHHHFTGGLRQVPQDAAYKRTESFWDSDFDGCRQQTDKHMISSIV